MGQHVWRNTSISRLALFSAITTPGPTAASANIFSTTCLLYLLCLDFCRLICPSSLLCTLSPALPAHAFLLLHTPAAGCCLLHKHACLYLLVLLLPPLPTWVSLLGLPLLTTALHYMSLLLLPSSLPFCCLLFTTTGGRTTPASLYLPSAACLQPLATHYTFYTAFCLPACCFHSSAGALSRLPLCSLLCCICTTSAYLFCFCLFCTGRRLAVLPTPAASCCLCTACYPLFLTLYMALTAASPACCLGKKAGRRQRIHIYSPLTTHTLPSPATAFSACLAVHSHLALLLLSSSPAALVSAYLPCAPVLTAAFCLFLFFLSPSLCLSLPLLSPTAERHYAYLVLPAMPLPLPAISLCLCFCLLSSVAFFCAYGLLPAYLPICLLWCCYSFPASSSASLHARLHLFLQIFLFSLSLLCPLLLHSFLKQHVLNMLLVPASLCSLTSACNLPPYGGLPTFSLSLCLSPLGGMPTPIPCFLLSTLLSCATLTFSAYTTCLPLLPACFPIPPLLPVSLASFLPVSLSSVHTKHIPLQGISLEDRPALPACLPCLLLLSCLLLHCCLPSAFACCTTALLLHFYNITCFCMYMS